MKIVLFGYGYWGKNVARAMREAGIDVFVCDPNPDAQRRAQSAGFKAGYADLGDISLMVEYTDAVAICTPPDRHEKLIRQALKFRRHVWVEKPVAGDSKITAELIALANETGRVLFVDHTFVHAPAVQALCKEVSGDIHHIEGVRTHLVAPREGSDVITDLLPHDASILLATGIVPNQIRAVQTLRDAFVEFKAKSVAGTIYFSWASALKQRRLTFYGTSSTIVYDHLDPHAPIKVYEAEAGFRDQWRQGTIRCPPVSAAEPLSIAVANFVETTKGGIYDRWFALNVQHIVDAALRSNGDWVQI